MKNALTIANAFLKLSRPEVDDTITNLKLQKLLYYAQGFYIALYNKALFKEDLLAWEHGPVVKKIYDNFKKYGSNSLPIPEGEIKLTKKEAQLINNVWRVYGQFSAWKLRDMTHNESPWKSTKRDSIISQKSLGDYFKTLVVNV